MSNPVTLRFIQCFELLKKQQAVPSARQFAIALGIHPQGFHKILKGERDITLEVMRMAVEQFNFNPIFLLTGEGKNIDNPQEKANIEDDMLAIPYLRFKDHEDFLKEKCNEFFEQSLPKMFIPRFRQTSGRLMAFEYRGHHLRPCIADGDTLVGKAIPKNQWPQQIKEGYVYSIISKTKLIITRMIDWMDDHSTLLLLNPNHEREQHLLLSVEDILQVWSVCQKLTQNVPTPENIQYNTERKISNIGEILQKQNDTIISLNATVEKLLKQNRSLRV